MIVLKRFVAVAAVALASLQAEQVEGAYVRVDVPLQVVELLGGGYAEFSARAIVRGNGNARGVLHVQLPYQDPVEYVVLSGRATRDRATGEIGVMLFLRLRHDGAPRPDDFAVATATPHSGVPGCDVWDFMGTGVHDGWSAMGDIFAVPRKLDRSTPRRIAGVLIPRQPVEFTQVSTSPDDTSNSFLFGEMQARIGLFNTHTAAGFFDFDSADGQGSVSYDAVFGAVVGDTQTGPMVIIILMRVGDDDPLGLGSLVFATVSENSDTPLILTSGLRSDGELVQAVIKHVLEMKLESA